MTEQYFVDFFRKALQNADLELSDPIVTPQGMMGTLSDVGKKPLDEAEVYLALLLQDERWWVQRNPQGPSFFSELVLDWIGVKREKA